MVWSGRVRENKYRLQDVQAGHKEKFFFSVPTESEAVEKVALRGVVGGVSGA